MTHEITRKLVKVKNVKLIVRACAEHLDEDLSLKDTDVIFEGEAVSVNGKEVKVSELPDVLENCTIEIREFPWCKAYINGDDAILIAYSDGEYAHIVKVPRDVLGLLSLEALIKYFDKHDY